MIPADLAALRAIVERAGVTSIYCACYGCTAIAPLVPAAQEALERLERGLAEMQATDGAPCDLGCWPQSHTVDCYERSVTYLRARLARGIEGGTR